jgi:hypothetical protein
MKHVISAVQRCDQGMGFVLYDSKGKPCALFQYADEATADVARRHLEQVLLELRSVTALAG